MPLFLVLRTVRKKVTLFVDLVFKEREQVGIDDIGLCRDHAVRVILVCFERAVLEELGGEWAGRLVRHDLVVLAVHDQNRHVDLFQILSEIGLRERNNPVVVRFRAAHHSLSPPVPNDRLDRFHTGTVEAVDPVVVTEVYLFYRCCSGIADCDV
jgi:hypothetical protein